MKQCTKCNIKKPLSDFSKHRCTKDGFSGWCKICARESSAKWYATPEGRAKQMVNTMKQNKKGKRANLEKTLTADDVLLILQTGKCQLTGLPFDFTQPHTTSQNPYAPSIDRIDSQKGYTKDNVRVVLNLVNAALGEHSDIDALPILKAMVKAIEKNVKTKPAT
jgi:hypothetical protein